VNGQYWARSRGTRWWQVGANPLSSTYGQLLASGPSAPPPDGVGVNDWAFLPITEPYFCRLVVNGTTFGTAIVRWNSLTHARERSRNYPDVVVASV